MPSENLLSAIRAIRAKAENIEIDARVAGPKMKHLNIGAEAKAIIEDCQKLEKALTEKS